jgi:Acetyltransferase (GNAT) family
MNRAPDSFLLAQVKTTAAEEAYNFHKSQSDEHIWPRTESQIVSYAEDGELFGVRRASTREFVGLCYSTLDENNWEVGGLTVSKAMRGLHLATFLVRFAVAHTIVWNSPWEAGQQIIAHVHDENPAPRNLLTLVGFEFTKKVEVPGHIPPLSMKRNEAGNVTGDEFRFSPFAVRGLLTWFDNFNGTLDDGTTSAVFEISGGLERLTEALRDRSLGS